MNFLKIFLIINLSLVLASCSNSIIVKIDKDKRIITKELKNGKIKTINQKFNSLYHQWLDVECASKETSFTKCNDDEIIYTELATLKIREILKQDNYNHGKQNSLFVKPKSRDSSSNEEQSSSNEEQSSSNEEQSSSNEEQSSSNEERSSSNKENNNFEDNDGPEGKDDAPDGHPTAD